MALTKNEQDMVTIAKRFGIDGKELANFMAQMSVESGKFTRLQESFKYTKGIQQIRNVVSSMKKVPDAILEKARVDAINNKPQDLADLMYNSEYRPNRMGNSAKGDGYKYSGKGYLQLTGKDNYVKMNNLYGKDMGVNIVENPEYLKEKKYAELSAIFFWIKNVQPKVKDLSDVESVTKIVNGGYNGLKERDIEYRRYLKEFGLA